MSLNQYNTYCATSTLDPNDCITDVCIKITLTIRSNKIFPVLPILGIKLNYEKMVGDALPFFCCSIVVFHRNLKNSILGLSLHIYYICYADTDYKKKFLSRIIFYAFIMKIQSAFVTSTFFALRIKFNNRFIFSLNK